MSDSALPERDPHREFINAIAVTSVLDGQALGDFERYRPSVDASKDTLLRVCEPELTRADHEPRGPEPIPEGSTAPYAVDAEDMTPGDPYRGEVMRGGRRGGRR